MKVTKWVYADTEGYTDIDDVPLQTLEEIEQTVIKEVKEKGYKFSGSYHQHGEHGCAIVDDKYLYFVSMREGGRVMQEAYDLPNEDGLGYVLWAWGCPSYDTEVYP